MTILNVKNMTLRFGVSTILQNIDFSLDETDKLGIIGVNGSGKSSLFRTITGVYEPEEGSVTIAGGKTVGILTQDGAFSSFCGSEDGTDEIVPEEFSVLELMLRSRPEMLRMEARLAELETLMNAPGAQHLNALSAEYTSLNDRFLREGGLEYRGRCASMLQRLGFDAAAQGQPVSTLSGGQRTRLALAIQLSREPDVLMLDEPTNHLDIETTAWLESFLVNYKKCVLVISHDRYFLDRVTTKTLAIENHRATLYQGGYTKSMEQRRIDRALAEKHWRDQQKEIARQEAYIAQQRAWNRERNIIAAESRQKLLDKMVKLEKPQNAPAPIRMKFTKSQESGNDVLSVRELSMAFGDKVLFENLNFLIKKKQRVLLIGPNGCGKSTLIKLILDKLTPTSGIIEAGYNVTVGYYDQENQNLTDENTVLEELWSAYPHLPELQIRNALAQFRFVGEDVFKTVAVLSGGERARLTLCKLILSHMNLLVLDEPTNHLDIDSREALEGALEQFDGTILTVSHDRYFIDKLATRILMMHPGPAFIGNLLDYTVEHEGEGYTELVRYKTAREAERLSGESEAKQATPNLTTAKADYLKNKQNAAEERKKRSRLQKLRQDCARIEEELAAIEAEMAGDAATDYVRVAELEERKGALEEQLLGAYEELEELETWAATLA
ncbi:MAG: ABC-F family ATP-binding cassette domain-containing protein [Ruminococcaceae bacterium]|nr:ABC-F family ATP-binding cassette domain-containing protein [Oscillospiraceae bacterium]